MRSYQVVKDVSFACKLRDDVDHWLGLHHLVQADDGGVEQVPHDLNLPRNLFQVLRVQGVLVDDLDRDFGPGQPVDSQPDDRKVAFAQKSGGKVVKANP